MPKILIVDDETERSEFLREHLHGTNEDPYEITHVRNWAKLEKTLNKAYQKYDLIVFDVDFSHLEESRLLRSTPPTKTDSMYQGYLLLKALREWEKAFWAEENTPPRYIKAVFTSAVVPSIEGWETQLEEYRVETYDYYENSVQDLGLVNEIQNRCPAIDDKRLENWKRIGLVCGRRNRHMYELLNYTETVAKRDCHVWIYGPTGTGKELVARLIHQRSPRATDVNALMEHLLGELAQLDKLGPGIFESGTTTLQDKINAEIPKSVIGFKEVESSKLRGFEKIASELGEILGIDNPVEKLTQWITDKLHSNQKQHVAHALLQAANLWEESQAAEEPKQGLFNFFDINCATFADDKDLLISLFGVPSGVYTDVRESRPGKLKAAAYMHGTLFLDEIGDLSLEGQAALLRVLQEKTFRRVNSNITEMADLRVVAATNKPITRLVKEGKFRFDLFMRLAQAYIEIPPLQARMEDFDALAMYFLECKKAEDQEQLQIEFDRQGNTLQLMRTRGFPWNGNIRELKTIVDRAYELAATEQSRIIKPGHVRRTLDIFKQFGESPPPSARPDDITIDSIEAWLEEAVPGLPLGECTYSNLQDLIKLLTHLFFQVAIENQTKTMNWSWHRRYSRIASVLQMDSRKLSNPTQLVTLTMKDVLDELLEPYNKSNTESKDP